MRKRIKDKGLAYAKHWAEDARLGTVHRQIIFTNGCFDGTHAGHLDMFRGIVDLCDFSRYPTIFVGVDSDRRYEKLRGKPPKYSDRDRMKMIEGMVYTAVLDVVGGECFYENCMPEGVPYVIPFIMDCSPAKCIKTLRPTDYAKGQDAAINPSKQFLKDMGVAGDLDCTVTLMGVYTDGKGKLSSSR
jgi:cytidyltransferase-like protein